MKIELSTLFLAFLLVLGVGGCQNQPNSATSVAVLPTPITPISVTAYPAPVLTETAIGYPAPAYTPSPWASHSPIPTECDAGSGQSCSFLTPSFFPLLLFPAATATPTVTPLPTDTPLPPPTPTPTIDFAAVRAQLQANGQDLGFVKLGFHVAVGGNMNGLGEWMRALDTAGVPFFLKSADNAGPLVEAQELMRQSGVPHVLVYRRSGSEYDVPNYDLPAQEAARQHWALHRAAFPEELDPKLVWVETMNELDKNRSEWLAEFATATAQLAMADGFRWAAFGWAAGEPEIEDWESPAMLAFLRLAGQYPDQIAVAVHEYSYATHNIGDQYPHKIGRFQSLFALCDNYGIPRPTVLITEWGWTYDDVPSVDQALRDIGWASGLYAPYPQVKGAAIWYLGPDYAGIANKVQPLIFLLRDYALSTYFPIPLTPAQAPIAPDLYRP